MINAEARARANGIDYYVNKRNITIRACRNENGDISVERIKGIKQEKKYRIRNILISLIEVIIYTITKQQLIDILDYKLNGLLILFFIWLALILDYFFNSINPKNKPVFKYHAAEHKVLNYWDKYEKITLDCDEIMAMSSISIRCGSTLIVVGLILVTLCSIGILFVPFIILKILWCIISMVVTFYLWANGKCNFLQKMVIREPSIEEVEVAVKGMLQYIEEKKDE